MAELEQYSAPGAKFLRPSLLTAPFSYHDDHDYDDNVSNHDGYDHGHGHDHYKEKNVRQSSLLIDHSSFLCLTMVNFDYW